MLTDLLTVAVLGYVGSRLVAGARVALRSEARTHIALIVRGVRARHILLAPVVLVVLYGVLTVLWLVPPLRWGWWTAIGGQGNPVIGMTDRTSGSPLEWIVPTVFLVLLAPALPLFAEREEQMFRLGAEDWSLWRRIRRGVEFGLVHALIGIPIAVALALSVGGWYFTLMYLREWRRTAWLHDPVARRNLAVLESTRAHFVYNAELLTLLAIALALGVN
jgi:hypothetical protein